MIGKTKYEESIIRERVATASSDAATANAKACAEYEAALDGLMTTTSANPDWLKRADRALVVILEGLIAGDLVEPVVLSDRNLAKALREILNESRKAKPDHPDKIFDIAETALRGREQ